MSETLEIQTSAELEWFAVQTKAGAEGIAVQTLQTLDVKTFLPLARDIHTGRRTARRTRPLFPGYCFARFQPRQHLHAVRYSRGVLRVVGGREMPWPVADAIIADIRSRLDSEGVVELERRRFCPGDKVRVSAGPFEGLAGVFDAELEDHLRVVVLLDVIRLSRVVMSCDWVEPAEAN